MRKCQNEVASTDRREKELADAGLVPLVHCKGTDYAAFFSTQSTQKQKEFNTDAANANARLSAQLQYIFAVSRVAHYLKSMMRDKIGSFASKSSVEQIGRAHVELQSLMRNSYAVLCLKKKQRYP